MSNQAKKFAKLELKSCIEEFEEKLNKFHMERKEQEQTAINAQVHHKKVTSVEVEGFIIVKEGSGEEDAEDDISEG